MPPFFIDTDHGSFHGEDEIGLELADAEDARPASFALLQGMMRAAWLGTRRQTFAATARDARASVVYVVTLTFAERWVDSA